MSSKNSTKLVSRIFQLFEEIVSKKTINDMLTCQIQLADHEKYSKLQINELSYKLYAEMNTSAVHTQNIPNVNPR